MTLKLDLDIVFLDLEATGTDPLRDRIIQIAMVRLSKDGVRTSFDSFVNPEMPIPPESIAIHHISDDQVRGAPRFRDIAPRVLEFIADADLGGFGVIRYDVPLLAAEFKRCGMIFDVASRRVVDAMTIFHRFESRTLSAAVQFYCGKALSGAHDARADAAASLDVFLAEVERYQGRTDKPNLPSDIRGIAEFCAFSDPNKCVDSRGKFVWRYGEAAFNFGKYQTRLLGEVLRNDRAYIEWLAATGAGTPEVADICRRALAGDLPKKSNTAGN